jgi:6-phosphogluconolactonase
MNAELRIVANAEELNQVAAAEFIRQASEAVQATGLFTVALSGGSTPKNLYTLLASNLSWQAPWEKMHFFWGDERHVSPDQVDSNYRMTHEAMLSKVPIPPANVHRYKSEQADAHYVADEYEQMLRAFFHLSPGQLPRFDLVLLGMGLDGHTASLFPGTEAVHERQRLVVANWVEQFNTYRITMTFPVLNNAACVIFLVNGGEKAETVRHVLEGDAPPERFPARRVRPTHGRLLWLVEKDAARLLSVNQS